MSSSCPAERSDPAVRTGIRTFMGMERIKRRRDFVAASRARSAAMPGLVIQARKRDDDGAARVGFTATKKLGGAVERNRIKRRLREAARLSLGDVAVSGYDYVIIGRGSTASRAFDVLNEDLRRAVKTVHAEPTPGGRRDRYSPKPAGERNDPR